MPKEDLGKATPLRAAFCAPPRRFASQAATGNRLRWREPRNLRAASLPSTASGRSSEPACTTQGPARPSVDKLARPYTDYRCSGVESWRSRSLAKALVRNPVRCTVLLVWRKLGIVLCASESLAQVHCLVKQGPSKPVY